MVRTQEEGVVVGRWPVIGLIVVALLFPGTGEPSSSACSRTWDGGAGTDSWHNAANWDGNVLPASGDTVCLPDMTPGVTVQLSSGQVDIAGLEVAGSLEVGDSGRLRVLGLATVNVGGSALIGGQNLQGGAHIYTLVNHGSVEIRSWVNGGAVTNNGTIEFSGNDKAASHNVIVSTGLDNQGTLTVSDPARPTYVYNLSNADSVVVNAGELGLNPLGTAEPRSTGSFFVAPGAMIRDEAADEMDGVDFVGGGTVVVDSHVEFAGTTTVAGTTELVLDHFVYSFAGGSEFGGNGFLRWRQGRFEGTDTMTFGSSLHVVLDEDPDGADLRFAGQSLVNRASLSVVGQATVWPYVDPLLFVNEGEIVLDPLESLGISGDFEQKAAGLLAVGIDGDPSVTSPGHARLTVFNGDGVLAGALRVATENGFLSTAKVVQAGVDHTLTGEFETVETESADGIEYRARYDPKYVEVIIDDSVPPVITAVNSGLHAAGEWSPYSDVSFSITATDNLDDIDGYAYEWTTSEIPPATLTQQTGNHPVIATAPDGESNWFHISAVDGSENASDPFTVGPFFIDTTGPTTSEFLPGELGFLIQSDDKIDLDWTSASDVGSGLAQLPYHLPIRKARDDEPWLGEIWGVASVDQSRWDDFPLEPGFNYCFTVVAKDKVGNESDPSVQRCTSVPLDDRQLKEDGAWADLTGGGYYLGTYSRASRKGSALVTTRLQGRRLVLIATRCPGCGKVRVLLAGKLLKEVSLASTTTRKHRLIEVGRFTSERAGRVRIEIISRGKPVRIEGFAAVRRYD